MKSFFKTPTPYLIALLLTLLYLSLPWLTQQFISDPIFSKSAELDRKNIVRFVRYAMAFPLSKLLAKKYVLLLIFPYFLLLCFALKFIYNRTKKVLKYGSLAMVILLLFLYLFPNSLLVFENERASISHGTVGNGWLENGKRIPFEGENYTSYSFLGYLLGRTFAHERVKQTLLDAYDICKTTCPSIYFVLGETGKCKGGKFLPHRTHQNGLSVDCMSPLQKGAQHYRTHHVFNLWGYGLEFDSQGKTPTYEIDYETMAQHLLALKKAAAKNGLRIQKVIFDPVIRPQLFKTSVGAQIRNLPYTKNRVTVRHDDHYHVDFALR
ncbi:MAG: penicillin-insensitive murein endopeptidase [Saprospiraceae bacterium]